MTRKEVYRLKNALETIESIESLIEVLSTENKIKLTVTEQYAFLGEDFNIPKELQKRLLEQTILFLSELKERFEIE